MQRVKLGTETTQLTARRACLYGVCCYMAHISGAAGCSKPQALPWTQAADCLQGVRSYLALKQEAARVQEAAGPAPDEMWLEQEDGHKSLPVLTPFLAYEASGGNFSWMSVPVFFLKCQVSAPIVTKMGV